MQLICQFYVLNIKEWFLGISIFEAFIHQDAFLMKYHLPFLIGILLLSLFSCAKDQDQSDLENEHAEYDEEGGYYTSVRVMPVFSGCEDGSISEQRACSNDALAKFIVSRISYPAEARENGIEGTVHSSFVVDVTGEVVEETIVVDIGGGCGDEVLRALQELPNWTPGTVHDEPVRVQWSLPIKFNLQ